MEIISKELVEFDPIQLSSLIIFLSQSINYFFVTMRTKGPNDKTNGINVAKPRTIKLTRKRFQLPPKSTIFNYLLLYFHFLLCRMQNP